MPEEKVVAPFSGTLKIVRNMEIGQDGKVLVMMGELVVKDGLIVEMRHREQIDLENTASGDHAMIYNGKSMLDLNSLIAPGSGLTLEDAWGISDTGYITGYAVDSYGNQHAFLLTPISLAPEPSSLVLVGVGAMGFLGYAARRARARA